MLSDIDKWLETLDALFNESVLWCFTIIGLYFSHSRNPFMEYAVQYSEAAAYASLDNDKKNALHKLLLQGIIDASYPCLHIEGKINLQSYAVMQVLISQSWVAINSIHIGIRYFFTFTIFLKIFRIYPLIFRGIIFLNFLGCQFLLYFHLSI